MINYQERMKYIKRRFENQNFDNVTDNFLDYLYAQKLLFENHSFGALKKHPSRGGLRSPWPLP